MASRTPVVLRRPSSVQWLRRAAPASTEPASAVLENGPLRAHFQFGRWISEGSASLERIVLDESWLLELITVVRALGLPEWACAGGVIRSLVWDRLHGRVDRTPTKDLDVPFFDPERIDQDRDAAVEDELSRSRPDIKWDVKNQAGVHLWRDIEPRTSLEDGLMSWTEPATAVGVRLEPDDSLTVVAPLGLDDLFEMKFRRNPWIPLEVFRDRVTTKHIAERWPQVEVIE